MKLTKYWKHYGMVALMSLSVVANVVTYELYANPINLIAVWISILSIGSIFKTIKLLKELDAKLFFNLLAYQREIEFEFPTGMAAGYPVTFYIDNTKATT